MKRFFRAILRPFARPFVRRIDHRFEVLLARNDALLAWQKYLPVLLNTISTQNAAARESRRRQEELQRQIEELRARLDAR